jgi:hypothetical protein
VALITQDPTGQDQAFPVRAPRGAELAGQFQVDTFSRQRLFFHVILGQHPLI